MIFDRVDDAVELVSMKAAGRIRIAGKRKSACAEDDQERAEKRAKRIAEEIAEEVAGQFAAKEFHL
jgi:hypothetical protein